MLNHTQRCHSDGHIFPSSGFIWARIFCCNRFKIIPNAKKTNFQLNIRKKKKCVVCLMPLISNQNIVLYSNFCLLNDFHVIPLSLQLLPRDRQRNREYTILFVRVLPFLWIFTYWCFFSWVFSFLLSCRPIKGYLLKKNLMDRISNSNRISLKFNCDH